MKKIIKYTLVFVVTILSITGCSKDPNKTDLNIILKGELDKKAYATSDIFKKFPISVKDSIFTNEKNKKIFNSFIKMGILDKNDSIYYLTKGGKRLYDEKTSGLTFVNSYEIQDIKEIIATDKGWDITLIIAPKELQSWIEDPFIVESVKPIKVSDYIQPQEQKIEILRTENKKDPSDKRFYKLVVKNKLNQSFSF